MNTRKVAAALNTISLAFGELAEALIEQPEAGVLPPRPAPVQGGAVANPVAAPPFDSELLEELIPDEPQGHLAICPAHKKPYKEGKFGLYCPSTGAEPAWTNSRGYCTLTPKNADVYLRAHAA